VVAGSAVYLGVSSDEEALATDPGYKCCTFRGSAVALDATTGRLLWKTFTVPPDFPGGAVWSSTAAVDGGSVYVTTGNNYNVPPNVRNCAAHGTTSCLPPNDLIDSVLAFDRSTGAVRWSSRHSTYDAWTVACLSNSPGPNCPSPAGGDFDFGSGPNLFSAGGRQLVGAGQKSGIYWALDPANGSVVWSTQVGPGGVAGGVEWGTATDGQQVYVEIANNSHTAWKLPNGQTTTGGFWSALNAATGAINWQTADPFAAQDMGPPSVANGVVYVPGFDPQGHLFALDAVSGQVLFSFPSGGSSIAGASIANGTVYWGSGYAHLPPGTPNNKLYAFTLP
jgi:polyvinyl alcohol dehydrogenase (cytochrome)